MITAIKQALKADSRPVDRRLRPGRGDRLHARLAVLGAAPKAVITSPEPLWTGDAAAARRLAAGLFLFGGALVESDGESPWEAVAPTRAWSDALHGFDWLDDLAATADPLTIEELKDWVHEWVALYGAGAGAGWRPDLTGRRLTRWICHAPMLLNGAGPAKSRAFFRAIGRQTRFLRRRWKTAPEGLPRFRAASGLIYAGLALEGAGGATIKQGVSALSQEARSAVSPDGGVPSRNPHHLVEIFAILVWAAHSLEQADMSPGGDHADAIQRLASAIRALRHGNGELTRFHGGGSGDPEYIDRALAFSGVRPRMRMRVTQTMGFHRITSGRTTLFFDGGAQPRGIGAESHHASAFCFEASIGAYPMIVNCGPGARFGEQWREAARATAAHSGLTVGDLSSARRYQSLQSGVVRAGTLTVGAKNVSCVREEDSTGVRLIAEHDAYAESHGLTHQRRLTLSPDGSDFRGEDTVYAEGPGPRATFDQAGGADGSVPFTLRFHLHPDVKADIFLAGSAVRILMSSGEVWVMRQLGGDMSIEESIYLDEERIAPRATKQIVVKGAATAYSGRVKWAFRRAETPRPATEAAAPREAEGEDA